MNRLFFLSALVLIFQLISYLTAAAIGWLARPFVAVNDKLILITVFILSNLFLFSLLFGAFRITLGYLAVVWLFLLAVAAAMVVYGVFVAINFNAASVSRVFAVAGFVGLMGFGVFNAYSPVVRHHRVQIDKPLAVPLRIALVSDLHLGSLVGNHQLKKLEEILNNQNIDLLLIAGDVMDDDTHKFMQENMGAQFAKVVRSSNYGAWVVLGNHDLYNENERAPIVREIIASGATLLDDKVDTAAFIKDGKTVHLNIVGRFDDHYEQRLPTADLLAQINNDYPTILLDHRPSEIDENARLPIDLQVSGHTHNGQIFPANFIVRALNRVGYGAAKVNDMAVVVSSGYGFWGVPLRLGSRAEVWVIDLVGK